MEGLSEYENYLYNVGCTFNIRPEGIYIKYYTCLTCTNEAHSICEICAQFCHKGHDLQEGNFGEETKTSCDCGNGVFSNCKELNSDNPLKGKIDNTEWDGCKMKGCGT